METKTLPGLQQLQHLELKNYYSFLKSEFELDKFITLVKAGYELEKDEG